MHQDSLLNRLYHARRTPLSSRYCYLRTELAQSMRKLTEIISLKIVGGCCGTDNTHINQIAKIMSLVI
ncbi:MAG: homocysteine S-methyltransferase family protein [Clostridiaceae bacterium]